MGINQLFKKKYFLASLQFATLLVFILLIYGAIGVTTNNKDFALVLRNTNLSNLIVWSYWWPFIIVTAIILGRFWCSICPMELITSFFGKIGFRRKPGTILKSGWIITLFYTLILVVGIHTFAIHRIPRYMAYYMLILLAVAVTAGLVWEKRTFCTYICPIGHLLGLYSMMSLKQLRVKDTDVCKNCKTKDCISISNHYKFTGRSCTSELYPAAISDNRQCILCGQCHKSCFKDNIEIKKRTPVLDLFSEIKLSWAEIFFFIFVSGFVVYEVLSEWKSGKNILMFLPDILNNSLAIPGIFTGTVNAMLLFVIIPTLFYSLFVLLSRLFLNESENIKTSFTRFVLAILPVTASMHFLKSILKTTSRMPYWKFAISDPLGYQSANAIIGNTLTLNKTAIVFLFPYISILALVLLFTGLIISMLIIFKQKNVKKVTKYFTFTTVMIYAGLFFIFLIKWRIF